MLLRRFSHVLNTKAKCLEEMRDAQRQGRSLAELAQEACARLQVTPLAHSCYITYAYSPIPSITSPAGLQVTPLCLLL